MTPASTQSSPSVSVTQPVDLEQASLHSLLVHTFMGISFQTDKVSQLKVENELMRREAMAAAVKSLQQELHTLHSELTCYRSESTPFPTLPAATSRSMWLTQPAAPGKMLVQTYQKSRQSSP